MNYRIIILKYLVLFVLSDKNQSQRSIMQEKNILYGGPEPQLIDAESNSLGDVILKKLSSNGSDVIFVSFVLRAR